MPEIAIAAEEVFKFAKTPGEGKCKVRHCRAKARPGTRMCSKHIMQLWRKRNPTRAAFNTLRDHARQRRIEFRLSFEEFVEIIRESGYAQNRGREAGSLQIDRIDGSLPYSRSNCRVMDSSENIAKGNRERRNITYRIALFERLGYAEDAEELRGQLRWLDGMEWIDPDSVSMTCTCHAANDNCPF